MSVMDQSDWESRLTGMIASQVRRWRDKRGLSAQRLADRTAELAGPIPRAVLANLESGRRDTVSVAELFILAKALNVAPVDLLFPAEANVAVEIAPGESLPRERAVSWFTTAQCLTCDGEPHAGFTCDTCGKSGTRSGS
jgi:transcriptional regulator with XRE-family HTH domain